MTKSDEAVTIFLKGYNCAQAVLYAFCDEVSLEKNRALKLACGFGAGMARQQEVCGAVTGAIMVIGAFYGRGETDDRTATEQTYAKAREFMNRFAQQRGSFICRQLLGDCDLKSEQGQIRFKADNLIQTVCVPCVRTAVEIVGDLCR